MSQLTVLHIVTRLSPGGPTLLLRELSEQPRDHRMVIAAGTPDPSEPEHDDPPAMGCEVVPVPGMRQGQPVRSLVRVGRAVDRIAAAVGADVLHSHTTVAGYSRTGGAQLPRVHSYHGTVHSGHFGAGVSTALRLGERALAARTDRVVAVADHDADALVADGISGRDGRVHVIPPPIQQRYVQPPPATCIAEREPIVGFVGRLASIKRIDVLCGAMRLVLARLPSVTFEVIGDGPESWRIDQLDAAFPGRVVRHGWLRRPRPVRERFRVEVMTSDSEGMPMAALEALVTGTPLVATRVGGFSDLRRIVGGRGLRLVTPGDPHEVARAITDELASDGHEVDAAAVRRHFAAARVAALHEQLYASLVS